MSTIEKTSSIEQELLLKARAYGVCGELLSEPPRGSSAAAAAGELRTVLGRLAGAAILWRLDALEAVAFQSNAATPEYSQLLLRGDPSPYETSYEPRPGVTGGKPFQLADIAGFYRAFGFAVSGERPDHIAAELEFVALLCAKEAYARIAGNAEGAEVCATARRKFVGEHLGAWLPQLSRRISEQSPGSALYDLVEVVMALTASEPLTPP